MGEDDYLEAQYEERYGYESYYTEDFGEYADEYDPDDGVDTDPGEDDEDEPWDETTAIFTPDGLEPPF